MNFRLPALAAILGALATLALASGTVHAAASAKCASSRASANGLSLSGCNFRVDGASVEDSARSFIAAHLGDFRMPQAVSDLVLLETVQGLASQHVRFQQYLFGYPVFGAIVSVHLDADGVVRRLHSRSDAWNPGARRSPANIGSDGAQERARQWLTRAEGREPSALTFQRVRQVWYPGQNGLALAWEVAMTANQPSLDVVMILDAANGDLLLRQDRIVEWVVGQGKLFQPNPIQSSGDMTLTDATSAQTINGLRATVSLPGLDEGTGLLKGRFADVSVTSLNPPWSGYPTADEPSRQYFYDVADLRFTQVNAYFAIDSAQRYVRALGFNADRTVPNGFLGFPITVYTQWDGADTSFFRPTTNSLHFGIGGVPDAEDGDIVVHEYGHAIQNAQNPNWGCSTSPDCEMRAMGEGFSDYLAAVVHSGFGDSSYQKVNAACVGEWDSTAYRTVPPYPTCLRRVDGTKVYPADLLPPGTSGKIHKDGEIWSRALWDLRNAIGTSVATQIVLEHQFSLPQDATMPQAALEMLAVDAELFGGANEGALRAAFCARGILQDGDCVMPTNAVVILPVAKDTTLVEPRQYGNEGASPVLRITGLNDNSTKTRIVLAFDLSGVNLANVKSAVLEMVVANSDQQWGIHGRTIDVHPVAIDFEEGNGVNFGADPSLQTSGTGAGATWFCPADTNIANAAMDCTTAWRGGRYPQTVQLGAGRADVPSVVQANGAQGRVRWNVTPDVKANPPVSRWLVKKTFGDVPGTVDYFSKEGALKIDASDQAGRRPRLVITLN